MNAVDFRNVAKNLLAANYHHGPRPRVVFFADKSAKAAGERSALLSWRLLTLFKAK
jgi:hypothetical protein